MIAKVMPIVQVKPNLKDALRMAVAEIERFLAMFYPIDVIRQQQSAQAIAGQWLARVKGFHDDDDFLYLVRDFLAYVLSGGKRSLISQQIDLFFSGFMPSYGAARTFLGIVNDGGTWWDVRAFMHSQAYGNAKQYVETFNWKVGTQNTQTEARAWLKVVEEEDNKLRSAQPPDIMAFQAPAPSPWVRAVPAVPAAAAAAEEGTGLSLAARIGIITAAIGASPAIIVGIILFSIPNKLGDDDTPLSRKKGQPKTQPEPIKKPDTPPGVIAIPETQTEAQVTVDTTNNTECKRQIEKNMENGARCEENGYTIMEKVLDYKRLIDPPKGKGLDGLFEKVEGTMMIPNPMPQEVNEPPPGGELVFIPETMRPPKPEYNYVGGNAAPTYPQFVVFEAKNIAKRLDPKSPEDIKKEAKRRLGDTCDGTQMSTPWTVERIPQALNRSVKSGDITLEESQKKQSEIKGSEYARWIFICLPGPIGSSSKLFILIDIVGSGMNENIGESSQSSSIQVATLPSSDNTF